MFSTVTIIILSISTIASWGMYVISREKKEALEEQNEALKLKLKEAESDIELHREAYIQTLSVAWNHLDMLIEVYPEVMEEEETKELVDISAYEEDEDDDDDI